MTTDCAGEIVDLQVSDSVPHTVVVDGAVEEHDRHATDIYDKLLVELSKRLPNEQDIDLAASLIESFRRGGRQEAENQIQEIISKLAGGA